MANIETTDVEIMVHADESTIPADVDKPTIHFIKGSGGGGGGGGGGSGIEAEVDW